MSACYACCKTHIRQKHKSNFCLNVFCVPPLDFDEKKNIFKKNNAR